LTALDPLAIDSQNAWEQFNEELPEIVQTVVEGEAFSAKNPPTMTGRGIYLFSSGSEHLYVGRTGVTARSRKSGKEPSTSFTARWRQHTGFSSPPHSAPFAMKLARDAAEALGVPLPQDLKDAGLIERTSQWWSLRNDPNPPDFYLLFQEAKRFISEDLEFRIAEFVDDVRGVRSHVAEVYADVILQTTFGDFSPS
jgi:hypothetical protein